MVFPAPFGPRSPVKRLAGIRHLSCLKFAVRPLGTRRRGSEKGSVPPDQLPSLRQEVQEKRYAD